MKLGENGRGLASRWYPETLRKRILAIVHMRRRFRFIAGDGLDVMRQYARDPEVVFFIDPPYTVAGRRLYKHNEIDHPELFALTASLAGDFLMTYDNSEEIRSLAERHGFQTHLIPMKSTHHEQKLELLIGRDLRWLRALGIGFECALQLPLQMQAG